MKNLIKNKKVWNIISQAKSLFLMLDFDGTLCPLGRTPMAAKMPENIKKALQKCAQKMPIAIISGRSLDDIKKKVGLKNLIYAGNHGLEWEIEGKRGAAISLSEIRKKLKTEKDKINNFLNRHKGAFLEDKGLVLALHYRTVAKSKENSFKSCARLFLKRIASLYSLTLSEGKKVFELRPSAKWNKGNFAKKALNFYQKRLHKKFLPICIGDDNTDEDIFRQFKSAITVHVGKNKRSSAKYFLSSCEQVGLFLEKISALSTSPASAPT